MRLNPKEQEKLMLHMAGNLAKERRARGLKLITRKHSPTSVPSFWNWQGTERPLWS